jgi:hypothetical protein
MSTNANFYNNTTSSNFNGCAPCGATVPFDQINAPGTYICNWSGHLLRVPDDGVTAGRSPMLTLVGSQPLSVTKISDNPYITVTKARLLASNFDLAIDF